MASKKKPVSRKRNTLKTRRTGGGRFRRFLGALSIAAVFSFGLTSYALNPQWLDNVSLKPVLGQMPALQGFWQDKLGLERFGLDRFLQGNGRAIPAAVAVDGYVQTRFSHCPQFFPGQTPVVPAGRALRELCFSSFAILHSGQTRTPVFVAQRLNRQMLNDAKNIERKDRFYAEARLPRSERAELNDYRGSGYSRGHMAPAGDMHDDNAMAQSFSLANMVPQNQVHNAGAWSRIESDTRKYVMRASGDVYVFTGPVYDDQPETVGNGRVAIPRYLYKLVFDATTGRSWVHWQLHSADTRAGRPISYDEFVRRTGLHVLPGLKGS